MNSIPESRAHSSGASECDFWPSHTTMGCIIMESSLLDGISRTSIAVIDQVDARIQTRLSGQVRGFQLLRREDGLVLRGRARTYYAKQIAQHTVMEVIKLPIAANEIEVT